MDTGLSGRVALVCGATSGLGLAAARGLAAEGAAVVMVGRRPDRLEAETSRLAGALAVPADLTVAADRARLVSVVADAFGGVDVLVLNGGGPPPGPAAGLDADAAQRATALLLSPAVELTRAFLPRMRSRGFGRVIAIGSSGVQQPIDGLVASNLGRAALAGYLKTLSGEVAADGVTVNMVLPGRIATARVDELDAAKAAATGSSVDEVRAASQRSIPAGRYGTPEEFAAVVTFLAGTGASFVTGEQVRVDGGLIRAH